MGLPKFQTLNENIFCERFEITVFNHRLIIQMFPDCDVADLVILVKSFVGVRLCLSEPDKEGEGAAGQPCYITFEKFSMITLIKNLQDLLSGSSMRIPY